MNLARVLDDAAEVHGERPALLFEDAEVSYADLLRRSSALAARLAEEVGVGDRVALDLPNEPEFVVACFAALRVGAIVVPLNRLLSTRELADRVARSTPRLLVSTDDRLADRDLPVVDPRSVLDEALDGEVRAVDRGPDDPAVILFTSGTSGEPKGAVLTHGSLLAAARNAGQALELGPDDVVLGAAPFSHVLGLATGILSTLLAGAAINVVPRFEADATLRSMVRTGTTVLLGVPTMCIALCEVARGMGAPPSIRLAHIGGAPMPAGVADEFEHVFRAEVREGYGLTELSGIATTFLPGEGRRTGSVGRPLGGTELQIVSLEGAVLSVDEPGEVRFRGPSVIPGYWQDPGAMSAALSDDGWLATGDIGYVDGDGYLYLVDRKKELIIRGGYNVYPREVEQALYAYPDVAEAAVVGMADDKLGEEVVAYVVIRPGAPPADEGDVQAFVKERVAAYKYPRHVLFVDALPKGPTGKILKRELDPQRALRDAAARLERQ